jgi:predicted oxidoreductase
MLQLSTAREKRLGYGFWRFREDEIAPALQMLQLARENAIDHIDTADVYGGPGGFGGAERLLGKVRRQAPALLDGAVVATKAGVEIGVPYNSSNAYLAAACEASLIRLGVERIDLFYVHRHDLLTHPEDLAASLDTLHASGKIGAVGLSNFTANQVDALARHIKTPISALQIEFSAACLDPLFDGRADQAMRLRVPLVAWSPLAGGRLGVGAHFTELRSKLAETGARYGVSAAATAIAFLQRHPASPTPLLGTKTPTRLRECLSAAPCHLARAEWYAIVEASLGKAMP